MSTPTDLPQPALDRATAQRTNAASVHAGLGIAIVAALWLLARPYTGVRHDGVLYMGQVLLHLQPAIFSHDLFFAFGSQDRFSVFADLVARLFARWGMSLTQMLLLWLSGAAFLGAAWMLLRPLRDSRLRWLALCSLATLSHYYGGQGIFSFAETFVTARTLAEPLALAALVALMNRRLGWALLLIGGAALAHPLMALPALAVGWLVLCGLDRRWWWALIALPVLPLLAWAGVSPFDALFQRFDPAWMKAVAAANRDVFVTNWNITDWQTVVLDFALLAAANRVLPAPLAALARTSAWVAAAMLLLAGLGADLLHNVLITQLQLWRALWLTHLLALLLLPALGLRLWQQGTLGRRCALGLAVAVLAINGQLETGWVLALWALMLFVLMRWRVPLSRGFEKAIDGANVLALVALTLVIAWRTFGLLQAIDVPMNAALAAWAIATTPTLVLPLAFWMLTPQATGSALGSVVIGLTALLLVIGLVTWDRRPPWLRYIETAVPGAHPFAQLMPAAAQVYWPHQLPATWAVLGRASYVSESQAAGLLFNRATAIEYERRRASVAPLKLQTEICQIVGGVSGTPVNEDECQPDLSVLQALCRIPRGPDFLIFPFRLSRGVVADWSFQGADGHVFNYHLYDCIKLR